MSDKMRWRYGDTHPVVADVDSATVIEIGDLLWQHVDRAKPASDLPDKGSVVENVEEFVRLFLGVAMERSHAGDTAPIRVATTGVFEFDCPSGTFELGDLVGPAITAGALEDSCGRPCNQKVGLVTSSRYAIARVARREAAAATGVLVDIRSTVMTGGIEGSSRDGV